MIPSPESMGIFLAFGCGPVVNALKSDYQGGFSQILNWTTPFLFHLAHNEMWKIC